MRRTSIQKSKSLLMPLLLTCLCLLGFSIQAFAGEAIKVGDKAPDFTLSAQDGKDVSLHDYLNQKAIVLFFYPKDSSPVCTKEACSFRDAYEDFKTVGAEVIGVSSDNEASHQKFSEKNRLPFKLLVDKDSKVRKRYGIPSTMGVLPGRVTYVIDKAGVVQLAFNSQLDSSKHVSEALAEIKKLSK